MAKRAARRKRVTKAPAAASDGPRWPAYTVERRSVDQLRAYEHNARKHPKKQIEQLRASIRQFGFTVPLLSREDGTLIAGHGRLEAARAEGIKEVPVIVATGWTEAQCRAYGLIDNKLGELSKWDADKVELELTALHDAGVGLAEFGFKDLASLDEPDASPQLEGLTYSVVVRCENEEDQAALLERLEGEGRKCEALIS